MATPVYLACAFLRLCRRTCFPVAFVRQERFAGSCSFPDTVKSWGPDTVESWVTRPTSNVPKPAVVRQGVWSAFAPSIRGLLWRSQSTW